MPILAVKNEIEIELTHKCNWNCPYCAIQTHQLQDIPYNSIIDKINGIENNSFVTLSGGEPGTLKKHEIETILELLQKKNCVINLNTNGMFLRLYPQYLKNFNQIIYHCSENLEVTDIIWKPSKNLSLDIRYMIIITDDNISKLQKFLDVHTDIKFDIVQATYNDDNKRPTLSLKNKNMIMTKFSNRMTPESIKRMIHEKDWSIIKFI